MTDDDLLALLRSFNPDAIRVPDWLKAMCKIVYQRGLEAGQAQAYIERRGDFN